MKSDPSRQRLTGWLCALGMVMVGVGWQLATRAGARSLLAPIDLALLRYLVPALVLAPVAWRVGLLPAGVSRARLALIVGGAGLPFGLLAMGGASFAPAAHMGALMPGSSPLLMTLFGWALLGERPRAAQSGALALLALGIALIALPSWAKGGDMAWIGDLMFLGASMVWAIYTFALRGTGLGAWQVAAITNAWSAVLVVPLWLLAFSGGHSLLLQAPWQAVALQFVWQGLLAGCAGLVLWGLALERIGAVAASSAGALVPALVALGAAWLLAETLDTWVVLGVLCVVAGVFLMARLPRA